VGSCAGEYFVRLHRLNGTYIGHRNLFRRISRVGLEYARTHCDLNENVLIKRGDIQGRLDPSKTNFDYRVNSRVSKS
jgi:hypothetical protein